MIRRALIRWLLNRSTLRQPDVVIGEWPTPYLLRWWLIPRNRWFNLYLHCFMRSDDDRAMHDHPWAWASWLLKGQYLEHRPDVAPAVTREGSFRCRLRPSDPHRIELIDSMPVWTLFIRGPEVREWGFHCPQGWVRWERFTGCGDD